MLAAGPGPVGSVADAADDLRSEFGRKARRPSLVANAVSNWTALAVNIAIGLLLTPFIIRHLGKSGYGIWSLVGSVVGYYGLLQLGVASAITPYAARYIGQRDWRGLNEVANTAMAMFTSLGVLVLLASFALSEPLAWFFQVAPEDAAAFRYTVWLLGAAAAIAFPNKVLVSVIRGYENYVASNIVVIGSSLVRAGLTVLLLSQGKGLLGVALAVLIADGMALAANAIVCPRLAADVRFGISGARWKMLRKLLVYGSTTIVIVIADTLRLNIDSAVIGKFLSFEAVGVYAIAAILVRYSGQSIRAAMKVLKPRFAVLAGAGDHDALQRTLFRSLTVSSLLSFGGSALLIMIGRPLIAFWVGDAFLDAFVPLVVLISALAFDFAQTPGVNVLYAVDRIRLLAVVQMGEAILNVGLSLLLVVPYGILGVALGTAVPCLLVRLFIFPVLVTRVLRISVVVYYWRILPPALFLAAIVVFVLVVLQS